MTKPTIIVWSHDTDDEFRWFSDDWYRADQRHLPENQRLFAIAKACIAKGSDVPDVKRRLESAGFSVRSVTALEREMMVGDFPEWH